MLHDAGKELHDSHINGKCIYMKELDDYLTTGRLFAFSVFAMYSTFTLSIDMSYGASHYFTNAVFSPRASFT